jgi:hypothetical protein
MSGLEFARREDVFTLVKRIDELQTMLDGLLEVTASLQKRLDSMEVFIGRELTIQAALKAADPSQLPQC